MLIQKVQQFLEKVGYDFDRPDISLHNFHPQIQILLVLNGIFFNNEASLIRFIWPFVNVSLAMVGTLFEIVYVIRGVYYEDYAFASECFCYIIILGTIPIVSFSVFYKRDKIIQVLDDMNSDIVYICNLGTRHSDHFKKGQLLIWKLCIMWFAFCGFIVIVYIGNTVVLLMYQSLFATQDEHMVRPLIFPLWLPKDDPYRTPNYEIFMFIQIMLILIILQNFCAYVYIQFHILVHYYYLMDMIIMDVEVIFQDLDENVAMLPRDHLRRLEVQVILNSRIERIVKWHTSVFRAVKNLSSIYGPPLVYQVMFSSVAICVMAYQVADQLEHGSVDFLFAILGCGAVMQLWIPCYLGTLVRDKAFAIGDAVWNSGWEVNRLGRMIYLDIVIIIQRTQQPVLIKFTALPTLTLETFSSIMSSSYSYFNMLRQSTKE